MVGAALVCAAAVAQAQTGKPVSVWSGVYTAAQNKRGQELHAAVCVMCHGPQLNGAGQPEMPPSPAIARAALLRKWSGQTVAALFIVVRLLSPVDIVPRNYRFAWASAALRAPPQVFSAQR